MSPRPRVRAQPRRFPYSTTSTLTLATPLPVMPSVSAADAETLRPVRDTGRLFCASFDDVDFDLGHAFAGDAQRFGGGRRAVDDATANERAAVVDADRHRASGIDVGDAQPRAERQRAVGGGQFVLVELLAARGVRVVAVEARQPIVGGAFPRRGASGLSLARRRHTMPGDRFAGPLLRSRTADV